jgi:hypothetical protein
MHCIGEKRPILTTDLVGAEIKGCSLDPKQGGRCTSVVCVNGADTEDNVMGKGGTFLLRVDGCMTDKGYPLTLKNPGQETWRILVKRVNVDKEIEHIETIVADKGFFMMPVRIVEALSPKDDKPYYLGKLLEMEKGNSKTAFKPLRAKREFRIVPNYYSIRDSKGVANQYDKVFPYLDARLYVTDSSNKTTEYIILNDSADVGKPMYNAQFSQIRFYDPVAKKKYDYNALIRKENQDYRLLYSPIPVHNADGSLPDAIKKIKPISVEHSESNDLYVRHPRIIADTSFQSFEDELKRTNNSSSNVKEIYEEEKESDFLYFSATSNRSVQGKYKFFYQTLDSLKKALKDKSAFHSLHGILDYSGYIEDLRYEYELSYLMRHSYCKPFFDELREKNAYAYSIASIIRHFYTDKEEQKAHQCNMKDLKKAYDGIRDFILARSPNGLSSEVISMLGDKGDLEPLIDLEVSNERIEEARLIGAELTKANGITVSDIRGYYAYHSPITKTPNSYIPLKYKGNQESPDLVLQLLCFSLAFSDKHANLRKRYPDFQKLCDRYDSLIYLIKPFPRVSEAALNAVRSELKHQSAYKETSEFIRQYESLDAMRKLVSFNPEKAKSIRLELNSLPFGSTPQKPFGDDNEYGGSPIEKANKLKEALRNVRFLNEFNYYKTLFEIVKKQGEERLFSYVKVTIGTLYNIIAPVCDLDEEGDLLSPFNHDLSYVRDFIGFLHKDIYGYLTQNAPNVMLRAINLEIYALYNEALFKRIAHARLRKEAIQDNLNKFLQPFKKKTNDYKTGEDEYLDQALKYFTAAREKESNGYISDKEAEQKRNENVNDFICDHETYRGLLGNVKAIVDSLVNVDDALREGAPSETQAKGSNPTTTAKPTDPTKPINTTKPTETPQNAGGNAKSETQANVGRTPQNAGGAPSGGGFGETTTTSKDVKSKAYQQQIQSSKYYQRSIRGVRIVSGIAAVINIANVVSEKNWKFYQVTGAVADVGALALMTAALARKKMPSPILKGIALLLPLNYFARAFDPSNKNEAYSESYNMAKRRFAIAQGALAVLLFCPIPHVKIAAAVLLLVSEIGAFISDLVTDEESVAVKEAIRGSVLYETYDSQNYNAGNMMLAIFGRDPNSEGYQAKYFNNVRGSYDNEPLNEKNYKAITEKLAKYYDEKRELYDRAFQYETTRLVSALLDYSIDIIDNCNGTQSVFIEQQTTELSIRYSQALALSLSLYGVAKRLILVTNKKPADERNYLDLSQTKDNIDIIGALLPDRETLIEETQNEINSLSLIVEGANNFVAKYAVWLHIIAVRGAINKDRYKDGNINPAYPIFRPCLEINIAKCEAIPLDVCDLEHIKKLNDEEKAQEEQRKREEADAKIRERDRIKAEQRRIASLRSWEASLRSLGL